MKPAASHPRTNSLATRVLSIRPHLFAVELLLLVKDTVFLVAESLIHRRFALLLAARCLLLYTKAYELSFGERHAGKHSAPQMTTSTNWRVINTHQSIDRCLTGGALRCREFGSHSFKLAPSTARSHSCRTCHLSSQRDPMHKIIFPLGRSNELVLVYCVACPCLPGESVGHWSSSVMARVRKPQKTI